MNRARILPARRRLDITPFEQDGQPMFLLRDVSRIAPQPLALTPAGCLILAHMDGASTYREVQDAFVRRFGQFIAPDDIESLVSALDDALMLQTPQFDQAFAAIVADYAGAAVRDSRDRWPDADQLRRDVSELLAAEAAPVGPIRGLIAPHLDYDRGRPCYAEAYSLLLRAEPVERFVILGTNHFGHATSVVATRKDFLTPLGRVETDRTFIAALEERLGESICDREFDHLNEHSIELQVHVLQAIFGERPFSIVPVLCPDPTGSTGTAPVDGDGPDLGEFADVLAELLAESDQTTIVIAGADLSHVGRHFGDELPATAESLAAIGLSDRRLLGMLELGDEEHFVEVVRRNQNNTNICSVGNLYALARALPEAKCEILHYHQAINMDADMHVTCAAGVYR